MLIEPDDAVEGLVHGHDERITPRALAFGVQTLFETVQEFCVTR